MKTSPVFSSRTPADVTPNRLTAALAAARGRKQPIIDLTVSNPTRIGLAYPENLFSAFSSPEALVYSPLPLGIMGARQAVADDYARRGIDVSPERIALTASTSEAYSLIFKVLCDPDDEVMVPRPSYPLFEHLARLDGVVVTPYDLEYDHRWSIDFESVERAVGPRTRAILAVSPNNPTGSYVRNDELDRLSELCARSSMPLVVDEVFCDYPLNDEAARQAGCALQALRAVVLSLGGCSKSVGLPQVKLGWIAVAGPDPAVAALMARLEFACDAYLSVSTPVQVAARTLLEEGKAVRRQIQDRIRANRDHLSRIVSEAPALQLLLTEGGWSAVMRVPSLGTEENLVIDLLERAGVLVHPGYFFDFPRESYLIVSLIAPEADFQEGILRIVRHFDCSMWPA
ncbi:MAG TPA: pyridoxal phosphate-dependent aminotransferase [Vicinamibacterales bacterium]|nr:pyridoxal phosphate-dependent aminotransferase [Vicinamibacterales bacterium]